MHEIVVELYFYAAIVDQGFRMSLEGAIEDIIGDWRASLGGLILIGWHLEG